MTKIVLTEQEFRLLIDGGTVDKDGVGIRLWVKLWGAYSESQPREE